MTRPLLRRSHAVGLSGLAVLLACALLVPASTAATTVPETVQVTDPAGDANYVNDQGFGGTVGSQGDHDAAASFAPGDILHVWFTNTADSVSLHIHTSAPAPSEETGLMYRVTADPAPPAQGCLWFEASIPSLTYSGDATATVENPCSASGKLAGELALEALPDGTGVATLTFSQSLLPELAAGQVISAPLATSRHLSGKSGVAGPTAPQIDNTKPGTDYEILVVTPSPSSTSKKCRRPRRVRCRR